MLSDYMQILIVICAVISRHAEWCERDLRDYCLGAHW